jgi:hypothetical protein
MFNVEESSTPKKANDEPADDDGRPPAKKRRKDELIKEQKEKEEQHLEHVSYDSFHCEIAKQFLSYGADISFRDSSGMSCLDIAQDFPSLHDLLPKPIEIDAIPILIPWRQECKMVDQIWYYRDQIAGGSFGLIFAGINEKDGREVAVKRIEKLRMKRPEDRDEK